LRPDVRCDRGEQEKPRATAGLKFTEI
jgi:hypothetical protein